MELWNWMLCGDFNHTEFVEDLVGPSPLVHGSKRRDCNGLLDKFDLIDNQLSTVIKSSPHFTCQAKYGPQLDQSRLDLNYSSDRGSWFKFVHEVVHDASQSLSDHHPSLIWISLLPPPQSNLWKSSYFKMDVYELLFSSTRATLQKFWVDQNVVDRDPRIIWELGWRAMKLVLKRIKQARDEVKRNRIRLEDLLFDLRVEASLNPNCDLSFRIHELAEEVKRRERAKSHL